MAGKKSFTSTTLFYMKTGFRYSKYFIENRTLPALPNRVHGRNRPAAFLFEIRRTIPMLEDGLPAEMKLKSGQGKITF